MRASGALTQLDLTEIRDLVSTWLVEDDGERWVDKVVRKGRRKWEARNGYGTDAGGMREGMIRVYQGRWVVTQGVMWDARTKKRM